MTKKILILLLLTSCLPYKKSVVETNNIPQIIFLTYSITKNNSGDIQTKLINKTITEGKLKNHFEKTELKSGDLVCKQLNTKSQIIQETNISNPLLKTIEYTTEIGMLTKKTLELDSITFTLRMFLEPNAKFIIIEEINHSNQILSKDTL